MTARHNPARGWTLVELMVGVSVFVLFLVSLAQVLSMSMRAYQSTQAQIIVKKEARSAFARIASDWHSATDCTSVGQTDLKTLSMTRLVNNNGNPLSQPITYLIDTRGNLSRVLGTGGSQVTYLVASDLDYDHSYFRLIQSGVGGTRLRAVLAFKSRVGTTSTSLAMQSDFFRRPPVKDIGQVYSYSTNAAVEGSLISSPTGLQPGTPPWTHPSRFTFELTSIPGW